MFTLVDSLECEWFLRPCFDYPAGWGEDIVIADVYQKPHFTLRYCSFTVYSVFVTFSDSVYHILQVSTND